MELSDNGLALLQKHEGYRGVAYQDDGGILTIAYGHTDGVKEGDTCTYTQGLTWLKSDKAWADACVNQNVTASLTQNEFDALVSFVYNVGCEAFKQSHLLKFLNDDDFQTAAGEFPRWCYVKGKYDQGLKQRRLDEQTLFETV